LNGLDHGAVPGAALGMHPFGFDAVFQNGGPQVLADLDIKTWQRLTRGHHRSG